MEVMSFQDNALNHALKDVSEYLHFSRISKIRRQPPCNCATAKVFIAICLVQKSKQLTAADGHIVLLEYMEEHPPLLSRPGAIFIQHSFTAMLVAYLPIKVASSTFSFMSQQPVLVSIPPFSYLH